MQSASKQPQLIGSPLSLFAGDHIVGFFSPNEFEIDGLATVVPLTAALPLFGTGLGILGFLGWRRRRKLAQAV